MNLCGPQLTGKFEVLACGGRETKENEEKRSSDLDSEEKMSLGTDTRLSRCQVARLPGYQAARLPSCQAALAKSGYISSCCKRHKLMRARRNADIIASYFT